MAMADALGRMISFGLRLHSPVSQRERMREIVSELSGIGGSRSIGFGENRVRSLPDAVSKTLARHCDFRVNGKVEDKVVLAALKTQVSTPEPEQDVVAHQLSLTQDVPTEMIHSSTNLFDMCPQCQTVSFAYEEGCKKCYSCGYSEC